MKRTISTAAAVAVLVALGAAGVSPAFADDSTPTTPVTSSPAPTDPSTDAPVTPPTDSPTDTPTDAPTSTPTDVPTDAPTSTPTDTPAPAPTAVTVTAGPSISGTAQVGKALTANLGAVTPSDATVSYQWLLSGASIKGATAKTFTPNSSAYVGKKVSVTVTAASDGLASYTATSAQTAAIKVGTLTAPTPTISGTTAVGKSLALKLGTWTSGTTLHYQWYAAGKALSGQTHGTLALGTAEYAKAITVKVTGSKSGYTTVAKTSKATAKISRGTLSANTPTVTSSSNAQGTPIVGSTLTAHTSGWTSGTALHYQWYANSTSIKGATKSTYKIPASLSGHTFFVHVTGTKTDYNSLAKNSAKTKAAVETLAYYKARSNGKTTYEAIATGLEGAAGAGADGDPGALIVAYGLETASEPTEHISTPGATSATITVTISDSSQMVYLALADPGMSENGGDKTATVRVYAKPAAAPSVFYTLKGSDTEDTFGQNGAAAVAFLGGTRVDPFAQ